MSLSVRWLPPFAAATAALCASACGGTVQNGDAVTGSGAGATSGHAAGGAGGVNGGLGGTTAFPTPTDGGLTDARYVDPGCPPAMKIQGKHACDPLAISPEAECGAGNRCVPFVEYADHCHTEQIGTGCQPAGTGRQGDDCSSTDCAAGFVCVTAGTGFQCAALCRLTPGGDTCTSGLICTPLDVDGFFVCG